jgi:hypothetical protein
LVRSASRTQTTFSERLTMSILLTVIDETLRSQHYRLEVTDQCYFLYEYTARMPAEHSVGNQVIRNLKKPNARRDQPDYRYKILEILKLGILFRKNTNPEWLAEACFVPIPPSKTKDNPDYDDRMMRVCRAIDPKVDIREAAYPVDSGGARCSVCATGLSGRWDTYRWPRRAHCLHSRGSFLTKRAA